MALIRPALPQLAFTMIPNAWVRDGNLRPNAKAVLFTLLSHAEGYRLSTAQIMRETGLGRDGVDSAIDHMLARGYLVSVAQRQAERGRFGENDYTVTSCTDRVPPIPADPPQRGRKVRIAPQRSGTATVPAVDGAAVDGAHPPIEEQGEKTTPTPNGVGAQLDLDGAPPELTTAQHAQAVAREHYDAVGGLVPFMAVVNVVKRALTVPGDDGAPRYSPDRVRDALRLLRDAGRPVTLQTVHAALETPAGVGARRGTVPYRDPAPAAYTGEF